MLADASPGSGMQVGLGSLKAKAETQCDYMSLLQEQECEPKGGAKSGREEDGQR